METLREKNISIANVEPLTDKIIHNTIVTVGLDNPNIKLNAPKDIIIKGTVSDSRGLTLPGVSIKIKGTMVGVSTDIDGKYSISVPDANAILVFSSIGFNSQEITVGDRSSVDVKMTEELTSLTEVVVTALGIKKEAKRLGYATATVNAQQISENRTVNFMSGLVGKMPGVNITPMGTGPAGSSKIRIRGQSSFGAQNSPLIVVNGVPINNTTFGVGGDFGGQGAVVSTDGGDGLSSINPDDIESISILKGGPAAALYGSQASNGVILITTKKGAVQKGVGVEIGSNFTVGSPSM
jgi:TonB-dependent SusC/RagA subfamily outer membrane receptor